MNKNRTLRRSAVLAALATLSFASLPAQTAPGSSQAAAPVKAVAPNPPSVVAPKALEGDEVIELSPFVVNAEKDNGYQATTTLAGTRLSTDLKDVGASISIITSQFLQDTGATDSKTLLSYVTGSEVGGISGNIAGGSPGTPGGGPSESFGPQAETRLRGLAAATEARNYFQTEIAFDSYNIDRVEVNRGANAVLFGTGSPAGILNTSLRKALMKDSYSVEQRVGSYNSTRSSVDLNHQIIPGELAIRIDGLVKRTKYQQKPAYENDDRLYAALTYSPKWARSRNGLLSGTVLRANYEKINMNSERPRTYTPLDGLTYWFTPLFSGNGNTVKPTWDGANNRTNSPVPQLNTTNPIFRNFVVWFDDPASGEAGTGSFATNGSEIASRQGVISNLPSPKYATGTGVFMTLPTGNSLGTAAGAEDGSLFLSRTLTDRSVFDYRNKLLEGPNRWEFSDAHAFNASLEQRFLNDRAGFELSYDKEYFQWGNGSYVRLNEVRVDLNTTLMDGTVNPNFGRPFVAGDWVTGFASTDRDVKRATVYYKFDFDQVMASRWAKWLGNVTLTGLAEQGETVIKSLSGWRYKAGPDWTYANTQQLTDINGSRVTMLSYIGPSLKDAATASGANLPGLSALQLPTAVIGKTVQAHAQAAGSPFVTYTALSTSIEDDGMVPNNFVVGASQTGVDSRNRAGIVQWRMLQDYLVLSQGWRRDTVDSYTAASPKRRADQSMIINDGTWVLPTTPSLSVSDETISRSAVLHVPSKWVRKLPLVSSFSLRYNTSENFAPGATRFDSYGRTLAPPSGTTKDVGFSLGLADNRVVVTATWFTTSQVNITAPSISTLTTQILEGWKRTNDMVGAGLNTSLAGLQAPPQFLLDLYKFTVTNNVGNYNARGDIVLTQDAVSKGAEFELHVNLTRNWRVIGNVSRTQSVRSNTGPAFADLFFNQKTNGESLYANWTSAVGKTTYTSTAKPTLAQWADNVAIQYQTIALQDGGIAAELRKWRANVVTTYSFDRNNRWLRGVSVGAGARWQDKIGIGFPFVTVPGGTTRIPDVHRPFYGPDAFNVDSWVRYDRPLFRGKVKMSVQLNVFNVLNDIDLVPVRAQPDGSIAVYRAPAERRFELSTKFDF